MQPFGSAPFVLGEEGAENLMSCAGLIDGPTAAAAEVVLWDDDQVIACTAAGLLVGVGPLAAAERAA
jgi:hypothetical protein